MIRKIDNVDIWTASRQIETACGLYVEAGTNGYKGGDSGHGSRTYIRIQDIYGSDISIHPLSDSVRDLNGVEIVFGGDCELMNIKEGLRFILQMLDRAEGDIISPTMNEQSDTDKNLKDIRNELHIIASALTAKKGLSDSLEIIARSADNFDTDCIENALQDISNCVCELGRVGYEAN